MSLSPEEFKKLYQHSYFFGEEYSNYLNDKSVLQKNFQRRIQTMRRFSQSGVLFEIGAAYGFFLELAQEFWQARGCDLSEEAARFAQQHGLDVTSGEFLDLSLTNNAYDVITLWDTLEHLSKPGAYIRRSAQLLKQGGILCLTTGDIGSLMARVRGSGWRLIHPPTHLYYFDRQTVGRLLEQNGFQIVHFEHCGYYRSAQQILYSLLVLNRSAGWRIKVSDLLKHLLNFSIYLNLFDIMFVIARKK